MIDSVSKTRPVSYSTFACRIGVSYGLAIVVSLGAPSASVVAEVAKPDSVSYYRDIRPIFQAHCQGCHQPAKASGEFAMLPFERLVRGGESGSAAIVPGKPDDSNLVAQITPADGEAAMPQGKPPLAAAEIALVRRWIEQGAKDDSPAHDGPIIDAEHPPTYSSRPVITSLDWAPAGDILAVAGFHEVLLHKSDGSELIGRLVGMSDRIDAVRFSPDGKKLAVTGSKPAESGEIQIWDVANRELLLSLPATHDSLYGACWSPDGKRLAFGCTDTSVRIIDVESGQEILMQDAHDDWVLGTAFSLDGSHLVSVSRDMSAKLTEVPTQRFIDNITSITPGALKGGIQCVVRHPKRDEILIGGADGVPKIYKIYRTTARVIGDDANLLWELPSLPGRIFGVDFSNDGRIIAAASSLDGIGQVRTYRMAADPEIPADVQRILNRPTHKFSDDEKARLKKHFFDGVQPLARIDIAEGGIYDITLSPDGRFVAAAGRDGLVQIFHSETGDPVVSFSPVPISREVRQAEANELAPHNWPPAVSEATDNPSAEPPLPNEDRVVEIVVEPANVNIDGRMQYAQLVVTAKLQSGAMADVTRRVQTDISQPIADISVTGLITPVANGRTTLEVSFGDKTATVDVQISKFDQPVHPSFIRDVAPILARVGCNQGTCHGAQAGKNGFKLSLRGYDPIYDVRALSDDLASRRINIASPTDSLMLLKPTAEVPHQGGLVLRPGSKYYEVLRRWIADGGGIDLTSPRVKCVKVTPENPIIEAVGQRQQVRVVAIYTDGSERDVTREAFLESGNTDVVKTVVGHPALLESLRRGEAPVLVRYEGQYAATTLTVMGDRQGFKWEDYPANNHIDELVAAKLRRTKTLASPICDDYTFVRRLYFDLTGLPPTPQQIQSFIDGEGNSREKRDALIDRLIGNEEFVDYWTNKWADLLMVNRKFLGADGAAAMRRWIRGEVAANSPYDEFVRKILTATGSNKQNPPAAYYKSLRTPEALMENTTHLFLATRFNCNKCHDHPFERWTQDQYYHLAAYFAQIGLSRDPDSGNQLVGQSDVDAGKPLYEIVFDQTQGDVKHVRTGAVSAPEFPFQCEHVVDGANGKTSPTRRQELAAWITSPDNQYFARSYVNRLWGYLTGRGIIEPLDDIRAGNPPTNPELLEFLTKEFQNSGFNSRHVIALICKSRTYQLSVDVNKWNNDDQINFSHARARRLPAEVLYDAIYRATGAVSRFPGVAVGIRAAALPDVGVELPDGFLANLGRPARESACECERVNELQLGPVMALVSGPTVGDAITNSENTICRLATEVSNDDELINQLYLRFFSRPASADEVESATSVLTEIDTEHQALVAELDNYSRTIVPQVANDEIQRQQAVARLETQIDLRRQELKTIDANRQVEHQKLIDTAAKRLAEREAQLQRDLPEWEKSNAATNKWQPVNISEWIAPPGVRYAKQGDGSVFVDQANVRGTYQVIAPLPLAKVTGIRIEAMADDRLPNRGPGRSGDGNFVITEVAAHWQPASFEPPKLIQKWSATDGLSDWSAEASARLVNGRERVDLFVAGDQGGITTKLSQAAGAYLVVLETGVRPSAAVKLMWTTAAAPGFDDGRSQRRALLAADGSASRVTFLVQPDAQLTGLKFVVEGGPNVLPIQSIAIFSVAPSINVDLKLVEPRATFSEENRDVNQVLDGNQVADNSGWSVAGRTGEDHAAVFQLAKPIENAQNQRLEFTLVQNYFNGGPGDQNLGRFRLLVTDSAAPISLGLPPEVAGIVSKPATERSDAERANLLAYVRTHDSEHRSLRRALEQARQPLSPDEKLAALENELQQKRNPSPSDPKLQQLRRAVTLSQQQLEQKRLTAVQDIAWALINSPAFLYNH